MLRPRKKTPPWPQSRLSRDFLPGRPWSCAAPHARLELATAPTCAMDLEAQSLAREAAHRVRFGTACRPQATVLAGEPLLHTRSTRCWRRAFRACGGGAGTPARSPHSCCSTTVAAVGLHAVPTRVGFSQVCTRRRERGRSVTLAARPRSGLHRQHCVPHLMLCLY